MENGFTVNRRVFFKAGAAFLGAGAIGYGALTGVSANTADGKFEVSYTVKEWKQRLTPNQFAVLRKEATERKYTSPLLKEKRAGTYHCAGCDLPVYESSAKYDSRTGWPSFYQSIAGAIGTKQDNSFFTTRIEVHCRRCGGHFGHIFNDGPAPTGKRHCLNGLALTFKPKVQG